MSEQHSESALPADWQRRDSAGSYVDAIAALRERLGAGWQPPQDSPYRARPTRCAEAAP